MTDAALVVVYLTLFVQRGQAFVEPVGHAREVEVHQSVRQLVHDDLRWVVPQVAVAGRSRSEA